VRKVEVLEGTMEGKQLVITCTLTINDKEILSRAVITWGAMDIAFIDQDFARHDQIVQQ